MFPPNLYGISSCREFGIFLPRIWDIHHWDFCHHSNTSQGTGFSFVALTAFKNWHLKKLDSNICPETMYRLPKIIHSPCWTVFIGTIFCWKCKLFSLGLLSSKEAVPKKTTDSEVCGWSWTGTLFLQRYVPFSFSMSFVNANILLIHPRWIIQKSDNIL